MNQSQLSIFEQQKISTIRESLSFLLKSNQVALPELIQDCIDYLPQSSLPLKALFNHMDLGKTTQFTKFKNILYEKLIEKEDLSIISTCLSFKMCDIKSLIDTAVKKENEKMLTLFLDENVFFLTSYDKHEMIIQSFLYENEAFKNIIHHFLTESDYQIDLNTRDSKKIFENILAIGKFDYIKNAQTQYGLSFTEQNHSQGTTYMSLFEFALSQNFTDFSVDTQTKFLCFLTTTISQKVLYRYLSYLPQENKSKDLYSQMLDNLIHVGFLNFNEFKDYVPFIDSSNNKMKEYVKYYEEVFCVQKEKEKLNEILLNPLIKSQKIKL